jgi:protein TonB
MMTNTQLATASLDDIVFDGRNQVYGAYQLRALYQRHVIRALVIATVIFALLLVFPLVAQLLKEDVVVPPKVIVEATVIAPPLDPKTVTPPPVAPPVAPPVRPPAHATVRFMPPVVVPNNQATEEVPEQAALQNTQVSSITSAGSESVADEPPLEGVEGPKELEGVMKPEIYTFVEQMPELPGGGGQAAIVGAIQRAVRYPAQALRAGVEGKVFASFTVNPKGEVVDVKIVKGLGAGLDEETLRAIKTLPKFIPGKQNGREVSVSFTVPITYRIQ